MVKVQQFTDRKEFYCELCGENFGKNYGMAENHERWECEVGHEVMKETVVDTWTTLSSRYRRNSARNRDSFLALADTLLRNFTLADLKELEVDIDLMREVASSHSHLPLAAMLVSKLQTAEPSHASNVINIQDSVINRSNLA